MAKDDPMTEEIAQPSNGSTDPLKYLPNQGSGIKRGPGQPSKLTERVKAEVLLQMRRGAHLETAFAHARIHGSTYRKWIREASLALENHEKGIPIRKRQRDLIAFFAEVEKAQAEFEQRNVRVVQGAADGGNWQAALALLERRLPGRWAKAQPGDVNVNVAVGFGYVEVRENAPGDRSGAEATIPEERQLEQGDQVIDV